ncbi:MAG: hypothetical protein GY799_30425 [Desulfobulbaceae bacterium]|nr:hypothetical protein [Desulfobulbaceae bacterium]
MIIPAGQYRITMGCQEFNLTNQMSQAILHQRVKQSTILPVSTMIITADNTLKGFPQHFDQHISFAKTDIKQALIMRLEASCPTKVFSIFVPGLIDANILFFWQFISKHIVRLFENIRNLHSSLTKQITGKLQVNNVLEKTLYSTERHMAFAFDISHHRSHMRPQQPAFANFTVRLYDITARGVRRVIGIPIKLINLITKQSILFYKELILLNKSFNYKVSLLHEHVLPYLCEKTQVANFNILNIFYKKC